MAIERAGVAGTPRRSSISRGTDGALVGFKRFGTLSTSFSHVARETLGTLIANNSPNLPLPVDSSSCFKSYGSRES